VIVTTLFWSECILGLVKFPIFIDAIGSLFLPFPRFFAAVVIIADFIESLLMISDVHQLGWIWLACGHTDMRRGFDGLSSQVQQHLGQNPFTGELFVFRGRRGDPIKVLCWDGQGLCLLSKRLEKGRFVWPQAKDGTVSLTAAQLSMLFEGLQEYPLW
jgi:transposase